MPLPRFELVHFSNRWPKTIAIPQAAATGETPVSPVEPPRRRLNMMYSYPLPDRRDEHRIHLRDGAILAAKVLQRRAEVVELLAVEDHEAVMNTPVVLTVRVGFCLLNFSIAVCVIGVLATVAIVTSAPPRLLARMSSVTSSQ